MVRLTREILTTTTPTVDLPAYDPASVTTGIVHFGVGGFHRAHEAMYVERLLRTGVTDWGICGVGLLPGDARMRDVMRDQDHLYTLMTIAPDGSDDAEVVAAITEYLFAPDDPAAVLAKMAEPNVRIVSLTITEGGYSVDDTTGEFAPQDADTLADLDDASWRTAPRSALGFLVAALAERRASGATPFAVMSCDNIQGNGHVARVAVLGFAERKDPELAAWIGEHVAFPNSMVDRITPATTDATRAEIARRYDIDDAWPIRAEHFTQWVLEDSFPGGRPALEKVGVQVVEDVEPYELMKLRLLNAGHQAISYTGALAGHTYAHEAIHDDLIREFLLAYMHDEAQPSLRPVPGVDLPAYCDELVERFGSEYVADTLARLATDGSDRIAKFLVPVLRYQLAQDGPIAHCVLIVAAWSRYLEGGTDVAINDRRADGLHAAVEAEQATPGAFVSSLPAVFGEVAGDQRFVDAFVAARRDLADKGIHACLEALKP
jgi:mannitol 2-dehydrogenase